VPELFNNPSCLAWPRPGQVVRHAEQPEGGAARVRREGEAAISAQASPGDTRNDNAENAIKHFASRRKLLGASFSGKRLQDYLVFFSIYQTRRNKDPSFLRLLRSGRLDVAAFAERTGRSTT